MKGVSVAPLGILLLFTMAASACGDLRRSLTPEGRAAAALTGRWYAPSGQPFMQFKDDTLVVLLVPGHQFSSRYRVVAPGQLLLEAGSSETAGRMDYVLWDDSMHLELERTGRIRLFRSAP